MRRVFTGLRRIEISIVASAEANFGEMFQKERIGMTKDQEKTINAGRAVVSVSTRLTISQELELSKERYIDAKRRAIASAPVLIGELCQRMSLRDLAKRVRKSPTYISQIATGKIECSDEVYFALSGVADGLSVAD